MIDDSVINQLRFTSYSQIIDETFYVSTFYVSLDYWMIDDSVINQLRFTSYSQIIDETFYVSTENTWF